jgi:hypothetical protein
MVGRVGQWLFVVSALLFISSIGFIIAGERRVQRAGATATDRPATMPVATVKQIMNGIVMPNAQVVYDAVGTVSDASGITETAPRNDKEWNSVADSAAALVESGNLLLMGERAVDNGDWVKMTHRFMERAKAALTAAQARKADDVFMAGGDLNLTCDSCHERYKR